MSETDTKLEPTAASRWYSICETNRRRNDETFFAIPIEGDRPVVVTVRINPYREINTILVQQGTICYKAATTTTSDAAYEEALVAVAHVRRMIGHGHIFRSDQRGVL